MPPGDPLVVALETSSRRPSVALARGPRRVARELDGERSHASDLLPAVEELLDSLGAAPRELDHVYVGTGPGSYTGLRVGVATALGLHRGAGASLVGVPSLAVLAFAELRPGERAACVLDARQGAYYAAVYARTARGVDAQREPEAVPRDRLDEHLPRGLPLLVDEASARSFAWDDERRAALVVGRVPTAAALLELGDAQLAARGPTPPEQLEPLYLRPFAARRRAR